MRIWMMLWMLIGISVAIGAAPKTGGREWNVVNNAVKAHRSATVIPLMEQSAALDPFNVDIKYDLGTLYLSQGRLGLAVWNLEKAMALSPRDRAIRTNLKAAHQRVHGVPSATPIWDAVLDLARWVTPTEAAWGWMGFTTLLSVLALGWGVRQVSSRTLRVGVLVWSILTIPIAIRVWDVLTPRGVVVGSALKLRISPDMAAPSITDVPAGTVVRLPDFRVGWVQLELPDGIMGWGTVDDIRPL